MHKIKHKKISKKKNIILMIILFAICMFSYVWYISNYTLSVDYYTVTSNKIENSFRVVQLTDLHNFEFGEDNEKLIKLIAEQNPDIIVFTGDMLNNGTDDKIVCNLIKSLTKSTPVYYSLGNHEYDYEYSGVESLTDDLESAGATVLEQQYVDISINGNEVRIGGLYGYVLSEPTDWMDGSEQKFMQEFEQIDNFKILLSHHPEGLLLWNSMETYDVDLIFSGHTHGGEIILPFIGGLYAPEEGFFPKYTSGYFEKGNSVMILSRGVGTSGIPGYGFKTRWNNVPEVVVTDIIAEKK